MSNYLISLSNPRHSFNATAFKSTKEKSESLHTSASEKSKNRLKNHKWLRTELLRRV